MVYAWRFEGYNVALFMAKQCAKIAITAGNRGKQQLQNPYIFHVIVHKRSQMPLIGYFTKMGVLCFIFISYKAMNVASVYLLTHMHAGTYHTHPFNDQYMPTQPHANM